MAHVRPLGYRKSAPDLTRDRNAAHVLKALAIPPEASVERYIKILDQKQLGSCVANAVAQSVRVSQLLQGAIDPPFLSRLMLYWLARAYEHTTGSDEGSYVHDAYRALIEYGFSPESGYPYTDDPQTFKNMPPTEAFRLAFDQKGASYHRIFETGEARLSQIRQAVSQGHFVVFGTDVSEDFCRGNLDPIAEPPPLGKPIAGGHCMGVAAYKTQPDGSINYKIANSWSPSFGDEGYVWFRPEYLTWGQTEDLWIVIAAPLPEET